MSIVGAEFGAYAGSPTTNHACPVPAGTQEGDILVASVWAETASLNVVGWSDFDWSPIHAPVSSGGPTGSSQQWWAYVDDTPPATVTVTLSSSAQGQVGLVAARGRYVAAPILNGGTATSFVSDDTESSPVGATVTRADTDGILFVQWWNASTPVTAPSGWSVSASDEDFGNYLYTSEGISSSVSGVQAAGPGPSDAWWANLTLLQAPPPGMSVREVLRDVDTAAVTLNTGAGTEVGDLLVLVHSTDFYAASELLTPTPGTWTLAVTGRNDSSDDPHTKVWWRAVSSAGSNSVTTQHTSGDSSQHAHLFVLSGADLTTPVSGAASATGFSPTPPAPSVNGVDGGVLICGVISDDNGLNYVGPPEMTGASTDSGFSEAATAQKSLTSTGSTGTQSFGSDQFKLYTTVSVAFQPAAGEVLGEAHADLGGLTAAATGHRAVHGAAAADLGGLAGVALSVAFGVAGANLGGLTAHAAGVAVRYGTAHAALGGLTAEARSILSVGGTAHATLGGLTANASGAVGPPQPRFILRGPTYDENLWTNDRFFIRYRLPRGITLAVSGDAVAELVYPYQGDLAQYDAVYLGGHEHRITRPEADILTAAGYGAFIFPI